MYDLQRQMATGLKAETYSQLGPDRTISLAMRAHVSTIDTFQTTITTLKLRLEVMNSTLDRLREIGGRMVNPDYAGLCRTMPDEIAQRACLQGFSIGIGWIVCRSPKAALRQ